MCESDATDGKRRSGAQSKVNAIAVHPEPDTATRWSAAELRSDLTADDSLTSASIEYQSRGIAAYQDIDRHESTDIRSERDVDRCRYSFCRRTF
jgi:hypothetical protein